MALKGKVSADEALTQELRGRMAADHNLKGSVASLWSYEKGIILKDPETGIKHRVFVKDGKLWMDEAEGSD